MWHQATCVWTWTIVYRCYIGLGDNCQILAVRSDICKIGQLSDRTTVSADNCQIGQLSDRTTVRSDNCQIGQLSVGQL